MNASNPDAPKADKPHEKTWVTYHRQKIYQVFSNFTSPPPIFSSEIQFQCRNCHGANLLGRTEGAADPACLDCHIIDPIKYPVLCYSCHGGMPVRTFDKWLSNYSSARTSIGIGNEDIKKFITRVNVAGEEIHLKHGAILSSNISNNDSCSYCHGVGSPVGNRHHKPAIFIELCFYCHNTWPIIDPVTGLPRRPDCIKCHTVDPDTGNPFPPTN